MGEFREGGRRQRRRERGRKSKRERNKLVETRLFLSDFIADQNENYIKMKNREKE